MDNEKQRQGKDWHKCLHLMEDGNCELEFLEWGFDYPCCKRNKCPDLYIKL